MREPHHDHLLFSFPDVHERAILRLYFCTLDRPDDAVGLIPLPRKSGFRLATPGRLVLHLRPGFIEPGSISDLRYPFAVLMSVTGDHRCAQLARPQNYVVTSPFKTLLRNFSLFLSAVNWRNPVPKHAVNAMF